MYCKPHLALKLRQGYLSEGRLDLSAFASMYSVYMYIYLSVYVCFYRYICVCVCVSMSHERTAALSIVIVSDYVITS